MTRRDLKLIVDNEVHTEFLTNEEKADSKEGVHRWPICGLPVESFLQVIAMDQQTCILEVYQSENRQGRFCLIQGSLYDAVCNDLEGEEAAMEMVSWENVRLNIRQIINASGFTKKIDRSLMSILMESSKRHDETKERQGDREPEEPPAENNNVQADRFIRCLSIIQENMGDALISASIACIRDGKELASYCNQKTLKTAQLFTKLTGSLQSAFAKDSDKKQLGNHYILNLKEEQTLMVLLFEEYQLGIIFNHAKCSLGLVQKAVLPKVSKIFDAGDS